MAAIPSRAVQPVSLLVLCSYVLSKYDNHDCHACPSICSAEIAGGVAAGVVVLGLGGFLFMKFSGRSGGSGLSSSLVANKRGTLF